MSIYGFIAVFWSLFDQIGSAWVLQAEHLHNQILGITLLPAQLQAANPLLIMLLTPLFYHQLYPMLNRYWPMTYMKKITMGLFIATLAFVWITGVQLQIDHGVTLSIAWQLPAYVLLTAAEIMISVTCLEFSYTQAPYAIKSLIMAFYLASVGVGNLLTSLINFILEHSASPTWLTGATYFGLFTGLMLLTALIFSLYSRRYTEKTYWHSTLSHE